MKVVFDRRLEEHPKTDFSELETDGDNHHPGNDRREKLSQPPNEPGYQDLASSANITIPQTTGNPKPDAAAMLEGR